MVSTEKVKEGIWKIKADSNVYVFPERNLVIDTGPEDFKDRILDELRKIIDPKKIEKVVLTHLHYDHCENIDLFPNATIYASEEAVEALKEDRVGATVSDTAGRKLVERGVKALKSLAGFDIIKTPGHSKGSMCLLMKKERILFSGDMIFYHGMMGRTDLPTSDPEEMEESLEKVKKVEYDTLCPGHG